MRKPVIPVMHMKCRILIVFLVLSIFHTCVNKNVMADQAKEYAVKVAFVFNFTKFIQWPGASFADDDSPYKLCFIGNTAVAKQFNRLNGKKSGTRIIYAHGLSSVEKCQKCDIIFISRDTDRLTLKKILLQVKGKPVLTIGETEEFTKLGGVINFFLKNDRLHFEINTNAAGKQGLKLSSRLLKLAVLVDGPT